MAVNVEIIRPTENCPDYCLFTKVSFQRSRESGKAYDICALDCHRRTDPTFLDRGIIFERGKIEKIPFQQED